MLSEEDKLEIRNEIRSCFDEILNSQGMSLSDHAKDHYFVSSLRGGVSTARKATWWALFTTLIPTMLYLLWASLTHRI